MLMLQGISLVQPREIEQESFAMITAELDGREFPCLQAPIVKRVIHATADFDYADNLLFSADAVQQAVEALRMGASIVTDTRMVAAGISKQTLKGLGGSVHCFIDDPEIAIQAEELAVTRSALCMDRAVALSGPLIFAIGNAPTALCRLHELVVQGQAQPQLIIAVPVGFVNVLESKQLVTELDVPYIVVQGRKGGSTVAAAICNALLYLATDRQ